MGHLLALGVMLLLTLVGSRPTKAVFNIGSHCKYLHHHLAKLKANDSDAKTLLFRATKEMTKWYPLTSLGGSSSGQLISAWRKVAKEECDYSSLEAVVTLRDCQSVPGVDLGLTDAISRYTNRCLTPTYVSEKIQSKVEATKSGPESFMDETFMGTYREDNPHEPIRFYNWGFSTCCWPESAHNAIIKSIQSHGDKDAIKDRKSLKNYLTSHLFQPCQNYYNRAKKVMRQINGAYYGIDGGRKLVESMPLESKDAIFRFNMCVNLKLKLDQKEVVDGVARKLKL